MSVIGLGCEFKGFGVARLFKVLAMGALLAAAFTPQTGRAASVPPATLETEIGVRLSRVREFAFMEEEARARGLRVYLFGGTAAGFAHYVNADLQREAGDNRQQKERFDYDFTSLYRSSQDLDIVVDGTEKDAKEFAATLSKHFPYFQGGKDQWEVRLLRSAIGDKEALLDNPDFLKQHTDSNSTGMIELTRAPGESRVRDLRDWNSRSSQFLLDVASDSIHFYFSKDHETTSRYRQGLNPPIVAAVRFLTKAFQFGLTIRAEDEKIVKGIIDSFDPRSIEKSSYVGGWMEKNASKLFRNADDIERAWNESERLGLRKKLIAISNDPSREGSLAWWMSKEPLRTRPVGQGNGQSAEELGLKLVAHETNSYQTYEAISSSREGTPNVFISRGGQVGEAASVGDGFYTAQGKSGKRGTGWTIRFEVDPRARLGTDFIVEHDEYVFRNKAALRVVPTEMNLGLVGSMRALTTLDSTDGAIAEKLRLRISHLLTDVSATEIEAALAELRTHSRVEGPDMLMEMWLKLPIAKDHIDVLYDLASRGVGCDAIARKALGDPAFGLDLMKVIELSADHIGPKMAEQLLKLFWYDPIKKKDKPLFDKVLARLARSGSELVFLNAASTMNKSQIEELLEIVVTKVRGQDASSLAGGFLSRPEWARHPRRLAWLRTIALNRDTVALARLIKAPNSDFESVVDELIAKKELDPISLAGTLSRGEIQDHPRYREWMRTLAYRSDFVAREKYLELARDPADRALVDRFLKLRNYNDQPKFAALLRDPRWQKSPLFDELVRVCLDDAHFSQADAIEQFVKTHIWSKEAMLRALPVIDEVLAKSSFITGRDVIERTRKLIARATSHGLAEKIVKRLKPASRPLKCENLWRAS